jgi:hypothetical protein
LNFSGSPFVFHNVRYNSRRELEGHMDAKWNDVVDRTSVRLTMTLIGFGAWLAVAVALIAAA